MMIESNQPDKICECLTATEMIRIGRLMRRLTDDFAAYNPADDIRILDPDGDTLGYVTWSGDMDQYIFIQKAGEE